MILKQGTNFTNLYVVLRSSLCNPGKVWIEVSPIRVKVTATKQINISSSKLLHVSLLTIVTVLQDLSS